MAELTARDRIQREDALCRAIVSITDELGYPPTHRELMRRLGWSSSTLHMVLDELVRRGAVLREPERARTLRVNVAGAGRSGNPLRVVHLGELPDAK